MLRKASGSSWNSWRSSDLYQVDRWGSGFFSVESDGHLHASPGRDGSTKVDLMEIVELAERQGCEPPLLVRFPEISRQRLQEIQGAFDSAITEFGYSGKYTCIYPIKVNQHRRVVESLVEGGKSGVGLEAGSKAELLAILAQARPGMPILCNGFKDVQYIEMALRGLKLGLDVTITIEKPSEFRLAAEVAASLGVRPQLGIRVKLATRGSGHWEATGGHKSKFGLTATEVLTGIQWLRERGLADCVQLLHFHIGSQIPNIRRTKAAVIEATRIYGDLVRNGVVLKTIDVGGGLGIDYSGAQNTSPSSMNYTLQEYANDVVYYMKSVCEQAGVPCPDIYSESGRALVAHQSVLIFPVFGSTSHHPGFDMSDWRSLPIDPKLQPLVDLKHALDDLDENTVSESYHDAQQALEIAINLFNSGHLSLQDRALAETMFREVCRKVAEVMSELDFIPRELENLQVMLADIYYGNFSLFRSLPDHWAIDQLFPVMPLHRLDERPGQMAILSDITCDSDGKLDRFIDPKGEKTTLQLHRFDGRPYYIGVFLVGAYQEILGDDHNLLGDVHCAEVEVRADGTFRMELSNGKTLEDMLRGVRHRPDAMRDAFRERIERAVGQGRIDGEEATEYADFYHRCFDSYTYLDLTPSPALPCVPETSAVFGGTATTTVASEGGAAVEVDEALPVGRPS
ncbi:MAG TPA: arginine decarboxylase [Planctomycetaceae bacterium]|nr:arginine decarboxylase [Planctomycetaceae bacterium]HRF00279.1 biosynthetic arginine decarboxylase [Pirellulaceae bacterium]